MTTNEQTTAGRFRPLASSLRPVYEAGEGALIASTGWGVVVLDGCEVRAVDGVGCVWRRTLPDAQIARGYAECCADLGDAYGLESFLDVERARAFQNKGGSRG